MANLDTRQKRSSGVMVNMPFRGMLPLADGTVDQADRQQTAFMYSGIAADNPIPPVTFDICWNRHRPGPLGR